MNIAILISLLALSSVIAAVLAMRLRKNSWRVFFVAWIMFVALALVGPALEPTVRTVAQAADRELPAELRDHLLAQHKRLEWVQLGGTVSVLCLGFVAIRGRDASAGKP